MKLKFLIYYFLNYPTEFSKLAPDKIFFYLEIKISIKIFLKNQITDTWMRLRNFLLWVKCNEAQWASVCYTLWAWYVILSPRLQETNKRSVLPTSMWVGLLVWISFFFTLQSSIERFCWKWETLKCMGSEQIPIKVRVQLRRPARATLFRCWSLFSFILWFPLLQWMIDDIALLIFWDSCVTALRCHMLQDGGSSYKLGVLPKSAKNKTRGQHWTRGSVWKSPVKH